MTFLITRGKKNGPVDTGAAGSGSILFSKRKYGNKTHCHIAGTALSKNQCHAEVKYKCKLGMEDKFRERNL